MNVKMSFEMACKRKTVKKSLGFPFSLFLSHSSTLPQRSLPLPLVQILIGNNGKWQKTFFLPKTENGTR
jgi:hypothetical protein